jgi:hypothetical protein
MSSLFGLLRSCFKNSFKYFLTDCKLNSNSQKGNSVLKLTETFAFQTQTQKKLVLLNSETFLKLNFNSDSTL